MNQSEARGRRAERTAKIRENERMCALDFMTWGDTQGIHAKRCVFTQRDENGKYVYADHSPCSRVYDPGPAPDDTRLYEGTSLGALWGILPTSESTVALLMAAREGWDIRKRSAA